MFPIFSTLIRFIAILVVELVTFFFFYNHPHGRRAVYFAWYASVIDVLAIVSGSVIMGLTIFAMHHPSLFTFRVPDYIFLLVFIVGSWQAAIHFVKLCIRGHTLWQKRKTKQHTYSEESSQ